MAEEAAQQIADREMLLRVGRGDQTAFSALYDRLSGPLYSLALKMLGNASDAQDALQEVLCRFGHALRLMIRKGAASSAGLFC
jgi:DNA-directed RNA polymerase specialized sigma24 family protein